MTRKYCEHAIDFGERCPDCEREVQIEPEEFRQLRAEDEIEVLS